MGSRWGYHLMAIAGVVWLLVGAIQYGNDQSTVATVSLAAGVLFIAAWGVNHRRQRSR